MGAFIIALVPILQGLFAGSSIAVVLSGLTIAQWAALAGAIAGMLIAPTTITAAETEAIKQIEVAFRNLHPAFDRLWDDVKAFGPQEAAERAEGFSWPTGQMF